VSKPTYVELGIQSAFSFLEGGALPEDLVARAADRGHGVLALSDVDGVYGIPRFHRAAVSQGVRAIVGARIHLAAEEADSAMLHRNATARSWRHRQRTGRASDDRGDSPRAPAGAPPSRGRVTLLVKSALGYRNLCRLLTLGHAEHPKPHARVRLDQLREHAQGLIALVRLPALVAPLREMFPGEIYGELWRLLDPDEERLNRVLLATGVPPLATGAVLYAKPEDRRHVDAFTCLRHKLALDAAGRRLLPNAERHVKAPDEMCARFGDLPEALSNTLRVSERCEFSLEHLGYRFPDFPLGPGETAAAKLRQLSEQGLRDRFGPRISQRVSKQLAHELAVIRRLELEGYFLIVWDIVCACREKGILVQGRGSAANSLVCYALGITAIDPIRYELLFERFLSEERGEWPDIDLDLPSGDRREEILQYVYARYGPHGAGMTANVITYRPRSAVREMGKVLGFSEPQLGRLASMLSRFEYVEEDAGDEIVRRATESGMSLRAARVRHLLDLVCRIQHLPRHLSQHSGGMIVAQGRLDEVVPLEPARMPGRSVIQWDKEDCADLGIIKIDLLGLGMMAVLQDVIPLIRTHDHVEIDLAQLPADDPLTYSMLQKADTVGVFQVESRAQMATLPRMKPACFYDLVVEVAIIRPGPIVGEMVQPYLRRRSSEEPVTYPHPDLEPILARTLGVPLFQEQLLRVAMVIAGFSGGEAEELRRAMGFKRSVERMRAVVQQLQRGMTARGIDPAVQEELIKQIRSFALYGFPESHAASFALLAYASAYLRAHHPACFLVAMLNNAPLGFYSPATLVHDAQRHGVRVLPIDVQRSEVAATVDPDGAVRIGLEYVTGLRRSAAERIARGRPYGSLADLARRAQLGREELEKLAEVGACQSLGLERRAALWQVAALRGDLLAEVRSEGASPLPEMGALEETLADYRGSGLTVAAHLMHHFRSRLEARGALTARALAQVPDGHWVRVAGAVIVRQRPGTAKGFLFLTLEDETGMANVVVVPKLFARFRHVLLGSGLIWVEGPLQNVQGVIHVRGRRFRELEFGREPLPPSYDFR